MTRKMIALACALAVLTPAAAARAADEKKDQPAASPSASPGAPAKLSGQVVKIDAKSNMVTVRAEDGSTHQFQGNPDTVKSLKVGDRIELTKRGTPTGR
jgi:Cu/Ag efflux protein CusF